MSDEERKRKKKSAVNKAQNGNKPNGKPINNKGKKKKKKKKKINFVRFTIFILGIVVFLVVLGGTYLAKLFGKMESVELDKDKLGIVSNEELKGYENYKKVKNIALFGVDSSDGVGRSDAIIIATVDEVHDKLKITSLMRDTYVNIEGHGYDKLNHAYAFGGPELAINTINKNFGLNIEDFVCVDFASLPEIIDIFGGIELDITEDEITTQNNINSNIKDINNVLGTNCSLIDGPGLQTVNGVQALAYSRIRYTDGGDYKRTERQRIILGKLFDKAFSMSISKYPNLINQVLPYVKTNLSAGTILSMATKVVSMGDGSLEQERFPLDGYSEGDLINDVYYLTYDEEATKKQIMDYLFDDKKPDKNITN